MVLPVIIIAHINHELGISDPISAIFKQVMCLSLADTRTIRNTTRPVARCEVAILSPVRVIGRRY
jgi:hypothetical protein